MQGDLTGEQREQLAWLRYDIGTNMRSIADPVRAAGVLWPQVTGSYAAPLVTMDDQAR